MKKMSIVLLFISLLSMSMVSSPNVRVGDWFYLPPGSGDLTYPANQAFHIAHGWGSPVNESKLGMARGTMRLIMDGSELEEDFIGYYREEILGEEWLVKRYVFNFPEGLEGLHHFQVYYANTCEIMLENNDPTLEGPVECDKPNMIYEGLYKDWWVMFQVVP